MGLTITSTGAAAGKSALSVQREKETDRLIALAGNPNVGKSTVFNYLTGLNQHTGNWPGKTVAIAQGRHATEKAEYIFVDLPGTYSLLPHSAEEEIACDFICYGGADAVVVVCDAACLERNLNLVLQALEITPRVVLCVNLMDEAARKGIHVDLSSLSYQLGIPVVGASARSGEGMSELIECLDRVCSKPSPPSSKQIRYTVAIEEAAAMLISDCTGAQPPVLLSRWAALQSLGGATDRHAIPAPVLASARDVLFEAGLDNDTLEDIIVSRIMEQAESIARSVVSFSNNNCHRRDRRLDRFLTSRATGIPVMLALLAGILWLTISGANVLSDGLSSLLFSGQDLLSALFLRLGAAPWLHDLMVLGVYRVLAWVVSVMLPPMAIFFPLFTLLEDFGYLPRVAFNLDHCFKKAHACGKQALTMW